MFYAMAVRYTQRRITRCMEALGSVDARKVEDNKHVLKEERHKVVRTWRVAHSRRAYLDSLSPPSNHEKQSKATRKSTKQQRVPRSQVMRGETVAPGHTEPESQQHHARWWRTEHPRARRRAEHIKSKHIKSKQSKEKRKYASQPHPSQRGQAESKNSNPGRKKGKGREPGCLWRTTGAAHPRSPR